MGEFSIFYLKLFRPLLRFNTPMTWRTRWMSCCRSLRTKATGLSSTLSVSTDAAPTPDDTPHLYAPSHIHLNKQTWYCKPILLLVGITNSRSKSSLAQRAHHFSTSVYSLTWPWSAHCRPVPPLQWNHWPISPQNQQAPIWFAEPNLFPFWTKKGRMFSKLCILILFEFEFIFEEWVDMLIDYVWFDTFYFCLIEKCFYGIRMMF